jgi:hypothetical protein
MQKLEYIFCALQQGRKAQAVVLSLILLKYRNMTIAVI